MGMFTEYGVALIFSFCSKASISKLKRSFMMPSLICLEILSSATCISSVPMTEHTIYSQMFSVYRTMM